MPNLNDLTEAVKKGNRNDAVRVTEEAIAAKTDPAAILDALVTGMDDVGRCHAGRWRGRTDAPFRAER